MNGALTFVSGLGLGSGMVYLFDPNVGRRRRAMLRDRLSSAVRRLGDHVQTTARDACQRTQGLVAEARAWLRSEEVSDDVLRERVRAHMGHVVSHPHAIEVSVRDGRVTLRGPVLSRELQNLLRCMDAIPGVRGVDNQLEVHTRADIAALQGGSCRLATGWPPAARMIAGAIGCGLMANCMAQRTAGAALLGTLGFGLFLRSVTNMDLGRVLGTSTTGRPGTSRRQPAAPSGATPSRGSQSPRMQTAALAGR